jgi:hypothetical protein
MITKYSEADTIKQKDTNIHSLLEYPKVFFKKTNKMPYLNGKDKQVDIDPSKSNICGLFKFVLPIF